MYEDYTSAVTFALLVVFGLFIGMCMHGAETNTILLGDDVTTSDRYTTLFNDSFSGRVVAKDDGMYTVRDENGTERAFEWTWLEQVDAEEIQ